MTNVIERLKEASALAADFTQRDVSTRLTVTVDGIRCDMKMGVLGIACVATWVQIESSAANTITSEMRKCFRLLEARR